MTGGGVSFVVPVHNAGPLLNEVLDAILAQRLPDTEIIVVDDASTDGSATLLSQRAARDGLRVLRQDGRGFSAAVNAGVRVAQGEFICQIDQDVVLGPGWLAKVWGFMRGSPALAAVQGVYVAASGADLWARVMGLDLQQRYAAIAGNRTNHVCTGVTLYRRDALLKVGLFDEELGYANDNDMSYRLTAAGLELGLCRDATAVHHWRAGLRGYWRQQYGQGYGRLQLVAKHPGRVTGDQVSGPLMMLHAPGMFMGLLSLAGAIVGAAVGVPGHLLWLIAGGVFAALFVERAVAGVAAAVAFRDGYGFAFPFAHLVRDVAWSWAIVRWGWRTLLRRTSSPSHSMPR